MADDFLIESFWSHGKGQRFTMTRTYSGMDTEPFYHLFDNGVRLITFRGRKEYFNDDDVIGLCDLLNQLSGVSVRTSTPETSMDERGELISGNDHYLLRELIRPNKPTQYRVIKRNTPETVVAEFNNVDGRDYSQQAKNLYVLLSEQAFQIVNQTDAIKKAQAHINKALAKYLNEYGDNFFSRQL